MINESLKYLHKYLTKLNNQFDKSLIEQENLDDLLDNIDDITDELQRFHDSAKILSEMDKFSITREERNNSGKELDAKVDLRYNLLRVKDTIMDAFEILDEVRYQYNLKIGVPEEEMQPVVFDEELEAQEEQEKNMQELEELRAYKIEQEKLDPKDVEAFKKWKKQQDERRKLDENTFGF